MPVFPLLGGCVHFVRDHLRQRAEAAVCHAEPGQSARRRRGRQHGVRDRGGRRDHLDRAEESFVIRNVGGQNRADARIGDGFRKGIGVVDRALHLRRRAGPIDHDLIALLLHAHAQGDRLPDVDPVVVDPILKGPLTVGQLANRGARHALGVIDELPEQVLYAVQTVVLDEPVHAFLGDVARCQLSAKIATHVVG